MTTKLLNPLFIRCLRSKNPFSTISVSAKICTNHCRNYSVANAPEVLDLDCLPNTSSTWLMLPPVREFDQFYNPVDNQLVRIDREKSLGVPTTARCVASTRGWLGYVDYGQGLCPIYLSDPFKGNDINVVTLPPLSTLSVFIDPNSDLAYPIDCYDGELLAESPLHHWNHGRCLPRDMAESQFLSQLTLSHPNPWSPDCKVAAQQWHIFDKKPEFCYFPIGMKMNNHTHHFKWLEPSEEDQSDLRMKSDCQLVFSSPSNLFFATPYRHCLNLEVLNIQNESIYLSRYAYDEFDWLGGATEFLRDLDGPEEVKLVRRNCQRDHYIVALEDGDLLLVFRYYNKGYYDRSNVPYDKYWKTISKTTSHFDVFRHDFKNHQLKLLDSLDGQSLFIGPNHSFYGEFPGMLRDCIYFSVAEFFSKQSKNECPVGIFNMKEGTVLPCYPSRPSVEATFSCPADNAFWVDPRPKT